MRVVSSFSCSKMSLRDRLRILRFPVIKFIALDVKSLVLVYRLFPFPGIDVAQCLEQYFLVEVESGRGRFRLVVIKPVDYQSKSAPRLDGADAKKTPPPVFESLFGGWRLVLLFLVVILLVVVFVLVLLLRRQCLPVSLDSLPLLCFFRSS